MQNNILVLGENTWKESSSLKIYCENNYSRVNIKYDQNGNLLYLDKDFYWVKVDGIIWRGQFESEPEIQKYLLEIIVISGVPCINDPFVTLNYSSNLSMYNALCEANMPVLNKNVLSFGKLSLNFTEPKFPCVLKIGNYHMGYGKSLIKNKESWQDIIDMAYLLNEPVTIEKYIQYKKDIRCQYIGGQLKCIERKPSHWKANVCPTEVNSYNPPAQILEITSNFAKTIKADIIGMDWILDYNNNWYILECNTGPGLIDFDEDGTTLNTLLLEKIIDKGDVSIR